MCGLRLSSRFKSSMQNREERQNGGEQRRQEQPRRSQQYEPRERVGEERIRERTERVEQKNTREEGRRHNNNGQRERRDDISPKKETGTQDLREILKKIVTEEKEREKTENKPPVSPHTDASRSDLKSAITEVLEHAPKQQSADASATTPERVEQKEQKIQQITPGELERMMRITHGDNSPFSK
jgi:hypothetical protein